MSANVVTLTVQLGSGGFGLARSFADQLGYRYYDWEVTSQAALEAGVSPDVIASAERVPPLVQRIVERFLASSFYVGDTPESGPSSVMVESAIRAMTSDDYRRIIEQVIYDLADRGSAVVVGHGAQVILAKRQNVLKVLIYGSADRRAERLAEEEGISLDQAKATIQRSDRDRAAFFKTIYKVDWLDAGLYDLSINTDHVPEQAALELLTSAAKGLTNAVAV